MAREIKLMMMMQVLMLVKMLICIMALDILILMIGKIIRLMYFNEYLYIHTRTYFRKCKYTDNESSVHLSVRMEQYFDRWVSLSNFDKNRDSFYD